MPALAFRSMKLASLPAVPTLLLTPSVEEDDRRGSCSSFRQGQKKRGSCGYCSAVRLISLVVSDALSRSGANMKTKHLVKISGVWSLLTLGTLLLFGSMGTHDIEFYLVTVPCGMLLIGALATLLICKIVERRHAGR